ncbi:MAG: hypothetical protein AAGD14_04775 [Planctomycetota bacterium]
MVLRKIGVTMFWKIKSSHPRHRWLGRIGLGTVFLSAIGMGLSGFGLVSDTGFLICLAALPVGLLLWVSAALAHDSHKDPDATTMKGGRI